MLGFQFVNKAPKPNLPIGMIFKRAPHSVSNIIVRRVACTHLRMTKDNMGQFMGNQKANKGI